MRFFRLLGVTLALALGLVLVTQQSAFGQETTGGIQGTVKDPSDAVVPHAQVIATGTTLVGFKETVTDAAGSYRFANLPPGVYTLTVKAEGFATLKRENLALAVGHLPTVDIVLKVGEVKTVVEVKTEGPLLDTATSTTLTNISEDVVRNIPHGTSFQSAIQFAPSARNEPTEGMSQFSIGNGNGATSPGSGSSGNAVGYTIAGGADSENSYLVEGQETANLVGGYSHTNVPFDFIDEMVVDTGGIQAEHGGSLGGVVNVIMQKGTNDVHGSVWAMLNTDGVNGSPRAQSRYDPNGAFSAYTDVTAQSYQPKRYHTSDVFPGFRVGLPLIKNKLFFFGAFSPEWSDEERTLTYNHDFTSTYPDQNGKLSFGQNTQTYYFNLRVDAALGAKIHVFGSMLDQGQRQSGEELPRGDDVNGLFNTSSSVNPVGFAHYLGYAAPNSTYNFGLDYSATPSIVLTTRFGYFFANYHDFGYPTTGNIDEFYASGVYTTSGSGDTLNASPVDASGKALPDDLQHPDGYFNQPESDTYTIRNADKRTQLDQDVSIHKSGWFGIHDFKFGYQLNRSSNNIDQRWPAPAVQVYPGAASIVDGKLTPDSGYSAGGDTGNANCDALTKIYGGCTGQYGYVTINDYGTEGKATSYNHAFFGQDSWTLGKGVTINYGLRVEKENLPSENNAAGIPANPVNFGWSDKVTPRIGFAWDPLRNGKAKIFGGYGAFTDQMKMTLAIAGFGGQYWQDCTYALSTALANVTPQFDTNSRYCYDDNANFGGATPDGLTFIESNNDRGTESVVGGLKPYRQHDTAFGVDYEINPTLAFEARWDRRRLDHVIEDAAIYDSEGNENYLIVNPGEGVDAYNEDCKTAGVGPTGDGYAACPANIKPARSYDGLELRLTQSLSKHFSGMFSYTYSSFRGNYCGLTNCEEADGGGGRNAPNVSRAFDESYFQFNSHGGSSNGKLAIDRPHAFKGYAYYELNERHQLNTTFGIFQTAYSGTPQTSFVDVGYSQAGSGNFGQYPVYPENLGKWVDITQNPTTGVITAGNARTFRTSWFTQSDVNIKQTYKVRGNQSVSFDLTVTNALNQREVVAYYGSIDTAYKRQYLRPGGKNLGYAGEAYSLYEHAYDWKALLNTSSKSGSGGGPITINSQYGKPFEYQVGRNIRFQLHYNF
jgi:hypothetical protein